MRVRSVEKPDYATIAEIYEKYWKGKLEIPSVNGRITEVIAENDEKEIVAYGMMKLWAEIMMIMDQSQPTKDKVEALKLLMSVADMSARRANLDAYHIFTNNEGYAGLLQKHFGCERINSIFLRKKLE